MQISHLKNAINQQVKLNGWVSNKRTGKGLVFIVLRDGSGYCQVVVSEENVEASVFANANNCSLETSVTITGMAVADERQLGGVEIQATDLQIVGDSQDFPIAKKEHGIEFLADKRHLWLRSKRQWAIMRIRNTIIFSIHKYFQSEGFMQMDAPIFTGNACEGTSTLFETEFYGETAYLSQSGQLYGEAMAMAMGKIYTFGPTFRAEKSKTRRHLSEFWTIEPEMAFYEIFQNMECIEGMMKAIITDVLATNREELEVLERDVAVLESSLKPYPRLTYDEAVRIIKGEQDVNGQNSIVSLQTELKAKEEEKDTLTKDIEDRTASIAAGGMKKGAINFNQAQIDKAKQQLN